MPEPLPQEGVAIQSMGDLRKLPPEILIEKLIQANRQLQDERRQAVRKDVEAKSYIKTEYDRLRGATAQHIRDLEEQNSALLKSLTRLQTESDRFREQITTLQVKLEAALHGRNGAPLPPDDAGRPYSWTEPTQLGAPLSTHAIPPPLSGDPIPPKPPSAPVVQAHPAP
jgi:hypothetical protein